MSPSSIFNFESLKGLRPRFPATLLAVIAVLALMEAGLRNISDDWLLPPASRLGVFRFMERELIGKLGAPEVLIMGSSRAADAVVPRRLDEALGLRPGATMNLGLPTGSAFDALLFYRRHRAKLARAKLLILNSDEWYFSSGFGLNARYRLRAPLAERWRMRREGRLPARPGETAEALEARRKAKREQLSTLSASLLADWAFAMRLKLRYLPRALIFNLGLGKTKSPSLDENNQVRTSRRDSGRLIRNPRKFDKRIHDFYRLFDTHPVLLDHVRQLVRLAREDGARVVLMQMPNRAMYQAEVERLYGPHFRQHLGALRELAGELDVALFAYRLPEECGLRETSYEDYGHLAFQGALAYTAFLARLIREERLLAKRDPEP